MLPYLLANGVSRIDLALVTHLHMDHYKGICELAAEMPVERIGMFEANRLREPEIRREWEEDYGIRESRTPELLYLKAGDVIQIEKGIFIEALAPEQKGEEAYRRMLSDEEDENASSLILKVHYNGLTALMTADMGFAGEEDLLERRHNEGKDWLASSILKTGHHGSRYSTSEEFLKAVAPAAAVIQVGKNNFGHPSGQVIELFQNYDIMTYRTDLDGAVLVKNIRRGEAVLSDVNKEKIWRISL